MIVTIIKNAILDTNLGQNQESPLGQLPQLGHWVLLIIFVL